VPYKKGQTLSRRRAPPGSPCRPARKASAPRAPPSRIKGKVGSPRNDIYTADDLAQQLDPDLPGHCFGPEVEITYDVV